MTINADKARDAIDHIVILMMENRSFDHMLGALSLPEAAGGSGRQDVDGLTETADYTNPHSDSGQIITIKQLQDTARVTTDTPHAADQVARQIQPEAAEHPNMQGFVDQYAAKLASDGGNPDDAGLALSYYAFPEVWALHQLADEATVCDRWFSSWPGPTQPNRMMALAGTSNDYNANQFPPAAWDVDPVFEYLDPAKVEWRSYSHDISFLRLIKDHRISGSHIDKINIFYDRARRGKLPHVTWIDPNFRSMPEAVESLQIAFDWVNPFDELFGDRHGSDLDLETDNSDHPDANIAHGQELIARVYNRLLENDPKLERTLFILAYDEHGGFYDHVVPPGWDGCDPVDAENIGYPNGEHKFGVRVPAIVASGWLQKGTVCHHAVDHAAITKTILNKFDLKQDAPVRPGHLERVPDLWAALANQWRDDTPANDEYRSPLRKPRPRENGLRKEMGSAMTEALKRGTPTERL